MPKCVVAISGKRKSGKDYCTRLLKKALETENIQVAVAGISNSLKMEFSKIHGINFEELLTDGPYKEKYRKEMIVWGEEARKLDSTVFCRSAINSHLNHDVIIISDCRRQSDYRFFTENFKTLTIRVESSEENRKSRGFRFVAGIDDAESECGLDDYNFDVVLENFDGEDKKLTKKIEKTVEKIRKIIE